MLIFRVLSLNVTWAFGRTPDLITLASLNMRNFSLRGLATMANLSGKSCVTIRTNCEPDLIPCSGEVGISEKPVTSFTVITKKNS